MNKPMRTNHPLFKIINNSIIDLPTPSNISVWWNFGSLLGLCLLIQILSGIFLSMHFTANIDLAFSSINHIYRNVNYGWLIRSIHSNGASLFFICLYLHMGRSLYYNSYKLFHTWNVGIIIMITSMATAFMGYVLPWGQMSFWGATVITNLLSAIPYIGTIMVEWIWGGFAVDNATLTRFFSFHFMFPFILTSLIMIHLLFLHHKGSNNPMGINSNLDKIHFHPYFSFKDIVGFIITLFFLILLLLNNPYLLSDPDNFIPANPLSTPIHIQPEWYFLFAYAILRSIPNKLGGVIALLSSILMFFTLPFFPKNKFISNQFYPLNQILFWSFITVIIMLTWIGAQPVEDPFIITSQTLTILYFSFFPLYFLFFLLWDNILN